MKLKNLLFATMFACAFASCSNEDDPINNKPTGEGNATLDIKIAAPTTTKATGETAGKTDQTISSWNVYVFNATNDLEKTVTQTSALTVESNGLTAGPKKVIVLANATFAGSTYDACIAEQKAFANEVDGTLSMNSKAYDINLTAGKKNYLGYATVPPEGVNLQTGTNPVYLYRNVAKAVLSKVEFAPKTNYPNATLSINKVFILQGAQTTLLANAAEWGATAVADNEYLNGVDNTTYTGWVTTISAMTGITPIFNYVPTGATTTKETNYVSAFDSKAVSPSVENLDSFYVYENASTSIKTLMVVEAQITYGANESSMVTATRYYTAALGDGITAGASQTLNGITRAATGVVRNLQYNVSMKITGPGYTTPFGPPSTDDTFLDVQVQVVPFGQVSQGVEIE